MELRKLIKKILKEETNKLDDEIRYLINNHKYVDEEFEKLKEIFFYTKRNNTDRILNFTQEFNSNLKTFYRQIFIVAKNAEKIIELLNESQNKKRYIKEDDSTNDLGFDKFNEYWSHLTGIYYPLKKIVSEIESTSDKQIIKSKVEKYYNLIYKDNNSLFELVKAIFEYLNESQRKISSNQYKTTTDTPTSSEIDWNTKKFRKRNQNNEVIFLSPEKVLERVGEDMGSAFDIRNTSVRIGNRLEKAMEYLKNREVQNYEPTALYVEYTGWDSNGQKIELERPKVGISDGRHRLLAAFNLGLNKFPFEVYPEDKEYLESNFS